MPVFQRARARIGTARLILQDLRGQDLATVSTLQSNALMELLRSEAARKHLDCEQRASLSTQLLSADFAADQLSAMLAVLACEKIKLKTRRDAQNAIHAFEYFSDAEWSRLGTCKHQPSIEDLILDVLVHRMQCINPNEPTVKLLTSGILTLTHGEDVGNVSLLEKLELKKAIAKRIKARCRRINAKVVEYCEDYPASPTDLAAKHPTLYQHLQVDGGFVPSRLSQSLLVRVEASYNCRGSYAQQQGKSVVLQHGESMQNPMMAMMGCLMQKMMQQRSSGRDDDLDCDLQIFAQNAGSLGHGAGMGHHKRLDLPIQLCFLPLFLGLFWRSSAADPTQKPGESSNFNICLKQHQAIFECSGRCCTRSFEASRHLRGASRV